MRSATSTAAGTACVLGSAVAYSSAGFFTRLVHVDVWTMLFWRGLFAFVAVLVLAAVRHRRRTLAVFVSLDRAAVVALLSSSGGMICYLAALRATSVADVAVVYGASPFVTAAVARAAIGERSSRATLACSAAAFAGVALTFAGAARRHDVRGDALALAMTCLMAVMMVALRRSRSDDALPVSALSSLLAAGLAAPLAAPLSASRGDVLELALFGAGQLGLGLVLLTAGARLLPASRVALIGSLDVPLAPAWVWAAFGIAPGASAIGGGALVVSAVAASIVLSARRAPW